MNWEVSSMRLKTSFFNSTLFFKNLGRSWPLWGGVTALGSLVPLYMMLAFMNSTTKLYAEDFAELLYGSVVYFLPAFTICYAVLVALFVWSYLHNSRSVGMMHSLAIDRTGLFVTNSLSGLAMLLIPYVAVGTLLCLLAACYGALDLGAVLLTITAVLLENILFFGMATLCAVITGRVVVAAAYYVILNFAAPVLDWLINSLAQEFIFGLTESITEGSLLFSPVISLYSHVSLVYEETAHNLRYIPYIENYSAIVVYGIVGLLLLALGWYLYRVRRSESAGDVVAFTWLRPVFRFAIAFISSMTLGRVLYEMFWNSLFYDGSGARLVPMVIWMAVGAVVGYYIACMLLEKTLRVFKGSGKNVLIVSAVTIAVCLAVALDLFGIEKHVPNAGNIDSVRISGHFDINCDAEQMPELRDDILALHEAIIADKDYIRASDTRMAYNDGGAVRWVSIRFVYTLKSGSQVERYYYLPLTEARMNSPDTYDGKFRALVKSPSVLAASVTIPENAVILSAYVEGHNTELDAWDSFEIDTAAWEIVYSALLRDAAEGNFTMDTGWLDDWEKQGEEGELFFYDVSLYVDYRLPVGQTGNSFYNYGHLYLTLQPTMRHTLDALVSTGTLDYATIEGWKTGK